MAAAGVHRWQKALEVGILILLGLSPGFWVSVGLIVVVWKPSCSE